MFSASPFDLAFVYPLTGVNTGAYWRFIMKTGHPFNFLSKLHIGALLCVLLAAGPARACTTFVLESSNHLYFGRNLDWFSEDGLVVVNPRQMQKSAIVMSASSPAKWVSKYGSVTFNCGGWEMPSGGMNEAGLVVECMWLNETQYPAPDARAALNSLQWTQYQLDNCQTVDEVIATDQIIRVEMGGLRAPQHYLVCDAAGNCAVIEFLNVKTVCHRGKQLFCRALANEPYAAAAADAKLHPTGGDLGKKPNVNAPFTRIERAGTRATAFQSGTPDKNLDYAFGVLDEVSQNDTVWRLVYDITTRQIHYRTLSHPAVNTLDLKKMDFACHVPVQYFELHPLTGVVAQPKFGDLTEEKYSQYLRRYLAQDWAKQHLGDMTPFIEPTLVNLRNERCAKQPASR
jgi:choloylglycine hydrolase